jgi:hypothetical protein
MCKNEKIKAVCERVRPCLEKLKAYSERLNAFDKKYGGHVVNKIGLLPFLTIIVALVIGWSVSERILYKSLRETSRPYLAQLIRKASDHANAVSLDRLVLEASLAHHKGGKLKIEPKKEGDAVLNFVKFHNAPEAYPVKFREYIGWTSEELDAMADNDTSKHVRNMWQVWPVIDWDMQQNEDEVKLTIGPFSTGEACVSLLTDVSPNIRYQMRWSVDGTKGISSSRGRSLDDATPVEMYAACSGTKKEKDGREVQKYEGLNLYVHLSVPYLNVQ